MPSSSDVTITLFDLFGSEVVAPIRRRMASGRHEVVWNAPDLKSGVYFFRLSTEHATATEKVIVAN